MASIIEQFEIAVTLRDDCSQEEVTEVVATLSRLLGGHATRNDNLLSWRQSQTASVHLDEIDHVEQALLRLCPLADSIEGIIVTDEGDARYRRTDHGLVVEFDDGIDLPSHTLAGLTGTRVSLDASF